MSLEAYSGYEKLTERIRQAILNDNISHAYIIEGDSCIDKESFAKDIIKGIVCREKPGIGCDFCSECHKVEHDNYEDLYYARADESSLKDATVAELQEKLKKKPTGGDRTFAIIESADSMTIRAQNRLLKTLEEPPEGTVIFLLSENTENLLRTITSRCIIYRMGNYTDNVDNLNLNQAEELTNMLIEGTYFVDLKEWLTKNVKNKKDAFILIDSIERLFHRYMTDNINSSFGKESIIRNVKYIEEARRDLLANVDYKYAIRNLILKIGG